jgi:hypothetical protein
MSDRERTPAERLLRDRAGSDLPGVGRPLSERARLAQRSAESYLIGANNPPRWMERAVEIDAGIRRERRRLAMERRELLARFGDDVDGFAHAWRAFATERGASREWDELNALIREHNEWYPVERDLPVDPVTGEWVTAFGRSHLRPLLSAAWVLTEFPPSYDSQATPSPSESSPKRS